MKKLLMDYYHYYVSRISLSRALTMVDSINSVFFPGLSSIVLKLKHPDFSFEPGLNNVYFTTGWVGHWPISDNPA